MKPQGLLMGAIPTNQIEAWEWPEILRDLVSQFGASAVWDAGLKKLSFPPTWIQTGSERLTLKTALLSRDN